VVNLFSKPTKYLEEEQTLKENKYVDKKSLYQSINKHLYSICSIFRILITIGVVSMAYLIP
jgi:hypothetical protein